MLRLIGLLTICLSLTTAQLPQAQRGSDQTIKWNERPSHILHSGNEAGRFVTSKISFAKKFLNRPQILATTNVLDWESQSPAGYSIDVQEITEEGFEIKYLAPFQKQIYGVYVQWIAIDDPRVHIGYVTVDDFGVLKKKDDEENLSVAIKFNWDKQVPQKVVAAHYLVGVSFSKGNWEIITKLRDLTYEGATIDINTSHLINVEFVQIGFIVSDPNVLWVSKDLGYGVLDENHPWLNRSPSDSRVPVSMAIPKDYQANKENMIWGFTGFDAEDSINLRIVMDDPTFKQNKATFPIGTWWDSQVYKIRFAVAIYKPEGVLKNKSLRGECIELFSECNFRGESFKLCGPEDVDKSMNWKQTIKSFFVPIGKQIQYELGNQVITKSSTEQCNEESTFTVDQIIHSKP